MSRMPEPYRIADRILQILSRTILSRRVKTARKLTILKFDDLNVMQEVDALYEWIDEFCRENLRALYIERYTELWRWLKHQDPDDQIDELVEMYLAGLWDKPNESTHYAFGTELIRKRDRAKEAIFAVPTRVQKQLELEKAGRYVIQQAGFYADIVTQDAELQAYIDADVRRVQWNVYGDDKVCAQCEELDGEIFDIEDVPLRPHLRCRCYLTPA